MASEFRLRQRHQESISCSGCCIPSSQDVAHHLFPHLVPLPPPHGLPVLDGLPVLIGDVKRPCFELVTSPVFLLFLLSIYLEFNETRPRHTSLVGDVWIKPRIPNNIDSGSPAIHRGKPSYLGRRQSQPARHILKAQTNLD